MSAANGQHRIWTEESPSERRLPRVPWHRKVLGVLFAIFCFEVGVYLVLAPWVDSWKNNYFATLRFSSEGVYAAGWWRNIWTSPYFRGAISGIGVVNIYISLCEIFRLRRSAAGAD